MTFQTKKAALAIVQGLSEPSKLSCYGYSLPAAECKTGAEMAKTTGTICALCYAKRGNYLWAHTQAALYRRLKSLSDPNWVDAMVYLIKDMPYFRWHDSGDIQDMQHLLKIVSVAKLTPSTMHWLPTREYVIVNDYIMAAREVARKAKKAFRKYIPENLVIRLSATRFEGKAPEALARKLGVLVSGVSKKEYNCPAHEQDNKCKTCTMCWDKNVFNIVYRRH